MSQQIEKSSRSAQMSAEQKQQQIEGGAKFAPVFTYCIGLLGPILGALIVGLVMWGAYSLLGGASTNFGTAFSITVTALDAYGNVAIGYRGTVHFSSSDSKGTMPNNYAFTSSDSGVHTFTVTLRTLGIQTVTATDTVTNSITGNTTVDVLKH